jgi:ribosome biogenesis GTPase
MRMLREQDHFQSTVAEKRKKDKAFGKMAKEVLKEKKKSKF